MNKYVPSKVFICWAGSIAVAFIATMNICRDGIAIIRFQLTYFSATEKS